MTKVGRNDPCPCGSGKKYKKCCEIESKKKSLGTVSVLSAASSSMPSLFQRNVTPIQVNSPVDGASSSSEEPKSEPESSS